MELPENHTEEAAREGQPFEPSPATLSGCGKPAVIGCLVLLALVAVGMIVLVTQSNRLLGWTMTQVKAQVLSELPEDVASPEERERLSNAFDAASAALAAGDIEPEDLAALQRVVAEVQASGGKLNAEQVEEITPLLERIGEAHSPTREPEAEERPRVLAPQS